MVCETPAGYVSPLRADAWSVVSSAHGSIASGGFEPVGPPPSGVGEAEDDAALALGVADVAALGTKVWTALVGDALAAAVGLGAVVGPGLPLAGVVPPQAANAEPSISNAVTRRTSMPARIVNSFCRP
jgi:hypothetical protein